MSSESVKFYCSLLGNTCSHLISYIAPHIEVIGFVSGIVFVLYLVFKFRDFFKWLLKHIEMIFGGIKQKCYIFINRDKYILEYKFINHANNSEAISFSRTFEKEILKIGEKYSKNIILSNNSSKITSKKEKIIFLEGCINEQLFSDDDKVNKGEFSISFLRGDVEVEGHIREKKSLSDITALNSGLINFIKTLFISLAAFNNDYILAKNIADNCNLKLKQNLYYYIYLDQLINQKIGYEEKLNVFDLLVDNNYREPGDGLEIIYSKILYKTGNIERAERIVSRMKGRDSNNPVWYINKAFLELAKGNEKLGFEEYEKMHRKFSITQLNKVNIKEVIDDIDSERRKGLNPCFDLGIIYLSYYYVPEIFNYSIAKNYLLNIQSKQVKKWLQSILKDYEEKYFK